MNRVVVQTAKVRICKHLRSPGIDSKESISPAESGYRTAGVPRPSHCPPWLGLLSYPPISCSWYFLFCLIFINYLISGCFFICKLFLLIYSCNFPLCSIYGLVNLCCTLTVKNKHPWHRLGILPWCTLLILNEWNLSLSRPSFYPIRQILLYTYFSSPWIGW
jgi:hypothetical protein